MKEQAKLAERTTMPAAGLAGKRIAPNVAADGETRIIREPGADPSDRRLSPERAQEVRKYTTSKEAQYYVLKQTQENLAWLRTQHRKSQPPSAMGMKSKKDQFNHLHNKSMLTRPMRPTVKPVEPKRVYDSGKLQARPPPANSISAHGKGVWRRSQKNNTQSFLRAMAKKHKNAAAYLRIATTQPAALPPREIPNQVFSHGIHFIVPTLLLNPV